MRLQNEILLKVDQLQLEAFTINDILELGTYDNLRKVLYKSDFYRLRNPFNGNDCAWSFVSKNKKEVYVMYVRILNAATKVPVCSSCGKILSLLRYNTFLTRAKAIITPTTPKG